MGNTEILTNLVSPSQGSGLQNLTDNIYGLFYTLIQTYIPGIPTIHKGIRPIASENVNIPCVMIQPKNVEAKMVTTVKFQKWYVYEFWFLAGGDTVDDTTQKTTDIGEIFQKLFSNNALNDRTTTATNQFKTYTTNWVDSEMSQIEYGIAFLLGRPNGPKYAALGRFEIKIQTVLLV
jgi:hypothetical protein